MALQENNSSGINCSSLRMNLFIFSKTLPFIGGLIVSYKFVEAAVVFILIDYLREKWDGHNRLSVVVTNLQDGLSSIFFVIASQISEEYTGCFNMITYCTPISILGLVLLWTSTSTSTPAFGAIFAALVLALGKGGERFSENLLEYQLQQDHVGTTCIKICWFVPSLVVYIMTLYVAFDKNWTFAGLFRFAAFLMLGTYVLFLAASMWYSDDELCDESNLHKIYRTCKTALGKWKAKYPTSLKFYYWKGYKQGHFYLLGEGVRLLPRVPRLFRWLDKAAIIQIEEEEEVSPEMQEEKGQLCTVKEVREVKSLVPMIYVGYTLFGYSFLLASGNTFFVSQANNVESVITSIEGNDIFILYLIMDVTEKMSRVIYNLILRCLRNLGYMDLEPEETKATIIRVGFGMLCAVICCLVAWRVEVYRLKNGTNSATLVPQFILLGMAKGLVDGGFMNLFYGHVARSMWSFADSFSELVIGTAKLLIIPIVMFSMDNYHDTRGLDRYFLMLGIVNIVFLLVFAYYSFTYAYKEVCPVDETLEPTHQPNSQDSKQENNNEEARLLNQEMSRFYGKPSEDNDGIVTASNQDVDASLDITSFLDF